MGRPFGRYSLLQYSYRWNRFHFFSLTSTLHSRLRNNNSLNRPRSRFPTSTGAHVKRFPRVNASLGNASLIWKASVMGATSSSLFISTCHSVRSRSLVVFYSRWMGSGLMICLVKRTFLHYQPTLKMSLLIWKRYALISGCLCLLIAQACSLITWPGFLGRLNCISGLPDRKTRVTIV